MNTSSSEKRTRRHAKVRSKISGSPERPRLSVFRSNKAMYAQLIDDTTGTTLAQADTSDVSAGNKTEKAKAVGLKIAELAKAKKIETVVFDRAGYLYAGRVKAVAEGAREGGLSF
ncbi:50S ribosomal protein L18 [Candidatus Campbellbacteria bacterium]|mgnify:CR=1 FL=1|nr:50S ribosomal protein L18 [Candidatus Campbellbacteria bacterium]|tara:strand:+ start:352 stop:696 length:345 start_codon:yes stop_codon:yes gene_type:complete